MRRILWTTVAFITFHGATTSAQDMPYEKYTLPNGMTVILHEDHTAPEVCVNLWYYVGAKDEPRGRSGFAHLFEHLMFMGTHRVPEGEFDRIMEAGGGFNNATTSEDRTNYFSLGPSELLPTLLWLDADRLEDLGKAMTKEKLDKQRAVVRNERRQSYENRPYGKADLRIYELMFPEGHPYHIPVIGTHEDLKAATVEDVKNFFARYYVPNNTSLVVAGDFDPAQVKPLIDRLFGTLPRGSDVLHAEAEPVRLKKVKRLTLTDRVQFARTYMVYHSPPHFAPGDAEMDLAAAILADGISSRLYKKLVYEQDLASDVSAYQSSMLLGSLFSIEATAKPGVSLDKLERTIDEVVEEFLRTGPAPDELERQKAKVEYQFVSRLQSLLAKADALNRYQFYFGEPNSFRRDLDRYRSATVERVRDWAKRVLTPNARLILRVIPEQKPPEENPRDARPEALATRPFQPPMPETFRLRNGLTVHHWERHELPLIHLTMVLPYGSTVDPPGKAGLTSLTVQMLDQGAGDRDALAFAEALDQLGARFDTDVDPETIRVDLSSLAGRFEKAMKLYADAVQRPRFDEKEWKRVHRLHLRRLAQLLDRPQYVARTVGLRSFFGDAHPYGRPVAGRQETADDITLDDVRTHYRRLFRPSRAVLLTAGDISSGALKSTLEATIGSWTEPSVEAPSPPSFPPPRNDAFRVIVVDRPGAVQTVVQFVLPAPPYDNPQRTTLQLLNTILGGSFTSRLNQNLRETHGYTYGAGCRYTMNPSVGYFTASSAVRADVTGASVREFLRELKGIRTGNVSTEEADKARAAARMRMIGTFAGIGNILDTAVDFVRNHRPFTELGADLEAASRTTAEDINHIARRAVPLEQGVLVLVGDEKRIRRQLSELDLPEPIACTPTGVPKE